jgi:tetratricopeptide (TPR) repeat protein
MRRAYAVCLFSLLIAAHLAGQTGAGEVSFANTGAAAAQPAFLRGLALLHDFEYPTAGQSFRDAQKIDPDFVMAYWGEAMTYTHPVWYQQDADAARVVLQRLGSTPADRAAKAKSDRERAYLQTIEVLYGDGSKDERDFKYADAMAALHQKYPDDVDATAFYALALLGTSHNGRDTATYMRSAALLEEVFPTHQHHPGVLHYLIHSYDDPVHAPLGMRAARLYGAVAPEAGHALHMTSHIFIAMGMWDEVIDANVRALAVVNAHRASTGKSTAHCGHYETWLHYALLQKRRNEEARKMVDACRADAFDSTFKGGGGFDTDEGRINSYADMIASQVMSGVPLDDAERVPLAEKFVDARFTLAYVDAFDAYQRGDAAALRNGATRLHALQKEAAAHVDPMNMQMNMENPNNAQRLAIVVQQIDALQMAAAGRRDKAVAELRKAAAAEKAMPFEFGPPFIEKPTLELLGDQLLAMKRPAEAADAYRAALARTPGRSAAAEGLRATAAVSSSR